MINCEIKEAANAAVHFLLPAKSKNTVAYMHVKNYAECFNKILSRQHFYIINKVNYFSSLGSKLSNYIPLSMDTKTSLVN